MLQLLNQYSFPLAVVMFLLVLAMFIPMRRWRISVPIYLGVVVVMALVYTSMRPGSSTVDSPAEAEAVLAAGSPVFVEFFSNT